MRTGSHNRQQQTLIHWLVGLVIHGVGAGIMAGALLLAIEGGPADLIFVQANEGLALGLFFFVCAQIGAGAALLIGCCIAPEQ
jgi:hypothetical protein